MLFSRTHDLAVLLDLALPVEPSWDALRPDLQALSVFAVTYRYPGESADESDASEAVEKCRNFRRVARHSLGL